MERVQKARLITAVKTPYAENGAIDVAALDRMLEFQTDNGVEGIVLGGTTGEGHLMTTIELMELIRHTSTKFGKKLAIIGNVGTPNTQLSFYRAKIGFTAGMHGALQINPYYGLTNRNGSLMHFKRIMSNGPTIIYNVP